MAKIKLDGYKCERCDHKWIPRDDKEPKVCPKCKSAYWNTPKKEKRNEQQMKKRISNL